MTPQLQQAIRLLQLPVMDLQTQIQEALEENVMLEVEEPTAGTDTEEGDAESTLPEVEAADDGDWPDMQPDRAVRYALPEQRFQRSPGIHRSLRGNPSGSPALATGTRELRSPHNHHRPGDH